MIIDIHAHYSMEDVPCRAYMERFVKYMVNASRKTEEEM